MSAEPGDVIFVVADFSIVVVSGGLRCHLANRFSILVKQLSLNQDHWIPWIQMQKTLGEKRLVSPR
jgi:hypothetical protein